MLAALQSRPLAQQQDAGYADTLREILQQPETWRGTAELLRRPEVRQRLAAVLDPAPAQVVLTGSGSSMYIGECLAPSLQAGLGLPVQAIAGGTLLTHWRSVLPPGPGLLISLARSGDSPESCGVVSRLLGDAPAWRHLVITCNAKGRLATQYRDDPRVTVLVLDERTNDRSLVMTSSFTNLLLAGTGLLLGRAGEVSAATLERAAAAVQQVFEHQTDALARLAQGGFAAALYLGSGGALGAAREGALKMLEMTGGKVATMAETFLGLRHGPMSSLRADTLVVALLSPDPAVRAYEYDLLRELSRKGLGKPRLLVGEGVPADVAGPAGLVVEVPAGAAHGEVPAMLAHVAVAQLLAFFRCLSLGGRPDAPSQGVLTRVVESFAIHGDAT
ncbi:tagatose-6-phosphate ketose isomerase [Frateuria sp. Soil773]|uniref:SIS domain-containing protein n=1 Tax=Frateuria sp. Soil773 TaxID=1736407 RepID=UPI0019108DCD|nr:tagatose-6-phosphate ketose isomerase [Frateuria sp. Soil773]